MRRIETEILINATLSRVWEAIADLKGYEKWCSSIRFEKGQPGLHQPLVMVTGAPDGSGKTYKGKGRIIEFIPYCSLTWSGGIKGVLEGHHFWHLSCCIDGRTKLIQGEDFYGLYPFFAGNRKIQSFKPFYENINAELKRHVERQENGTPWR